VSGRFGYINEPELAQAPRAMAYAELLKNYVHGVDFFIEKGTGRIVPSRINALTAPALCAILLDSLRRWEEQVQLGLQIGLQGTLVVAPYAGQGGFPKGPGVAATSMFAGTAARAALSPTARQLAREMDALLTSGGTKDLAAEGVEFIGVQVARKGSTVAVKRYMSYASSPGQGIGYRMAREFEDAAAAVGRANGAKTVTVDVGVIINEGWKKILTARGYRYVASEGSWIKTLALQ
jgi:hypothetical protein